MVLPGFLVGRASGLPFPDRGNDKSIRLPIPQDVNADLLTHIDDGLHVLFPCDRFTLVEDVSCMVLGEAPLRSLRVKVAGKKDI